jgi:hypothetical protein
MKSITNLFILFFILIVLGFLYKRFEDKRIREEEGNTYESIQKYLLDGDTLDKSKKPILWIHVPYEYNSRNWLSFGSRSSLDLNQPYLYLTVRSIIKQCDDSFTICIIDDTSFKKLIPNWNINMTNISDPILSNMRALGMMKLLYIYGGLICPISFVCLKNLDQLYNNGIRGDKMFICETVDRNITSTDLDFYPNLTFCGAPKECETVRELCNFIQQISSHDYTADVKFLGEYDKWCKQRIENGKINLIDGQDIGTKTIDDKQIIVDDLISNHYLNLYQGAYGILIPAEEILSRLKFEWFARMSPKQVLESDTIIGNYLLLSISPEEGILEPLEPRINKAITNKFVGFWKTPLYDGLYMVSQPNMLGDNVPRVPYTGYR